MQLGAIHTYPVKSSRARSHKALALEPLGLTDDRRYALVDEAGTVVSQREAPELAVLDAEPHEDGLVLVHPEKGERFVTRPDGSERLTIRLWGGETDTALADAATNAALSAWFGRPLRLVHLDDPAARMADPAFAPADTPAGLSDGFPLLVTTSASLRELGRMIVEAGGELVPMSRFRPNLVIDGAKPWAEDGWASLRIGEAVVDLVKPCARCIMTRVDQASGVVAGDEPLTTLRRHRLSGDRAVPGVLFGWNAVVREPGPVRLGDPVVVEATRDPAGLLRVPRSARQASRA